MTYTPQQSITVELAGQAVTVERVSARKASRILAILRAVSKDYPDLLKDLATFERNYAEENTVSIPRGDAELRYGAAQPLVKDGEPVLYPLTLPTGEAHPRAGEPMMAPGPLEHMTEEAWAAAGQVIKRPKAPSTAERIGAVLDKALEKSEAHVYKLLALLTITNADVKAWRKDGTLDEKLEGKVDDLLDDAYADELLELAVAGGELVEGQFVAKARSLGGRLGNALRLLGVNPEALQRTMNPTLQTAAEAPQTAQEEGALEEAPTPTSTDGSATSNGTASSSRPTSSTDSDDSSDGPPTPSSTSPSTSSAPSTGAGG